MPIDLALSFVLAALVWLVWRYVGQAKYRRWLIQQEIDDMREERN